MNKLMLLANCTAVALMAYTGYVSWASSPQYLNENTEIAARRMGGEEGMHHHPANHPGAHTNQHMNDYHHGANFRGNNFEGSGGGASEPVVVPMPYSDGSQSSGGQDSSGGSPDS